MKKSTIKRIKKFCNENDIWINHLYGIYYFCDSNYNLIDYTLYNKLKKLLGIPKKENYTLISIYGTLCVVTSKDFNPYYKAYINDSNVYDIFEDYCAFEFDFINSALNDIGYYRPYLSCIDEQRIIDRCIMFANPKSNINGLADFEFIKCVSGPSFISYNDIMSLINNNAIKMKGFK